MTSPSLPGDIDLLDPDFYVGDPHPAYQWMRENDPVYRDEKNGLWAITRLDDLRAVEKDAELFSSRGNYRANTILEERTMIAKDDPAHLGQRRLLADLFTPRAVSEREDEVRAIVVEAIEQSFASGPVDVVESLAARVPAILTARLLGFDDALWPDVKIWSEKLMRTDRAPFVPKLKLGMLTTVRDMSPVLQDALKKRAEKREDDIPSRWLDPLAENATGKGDFDYLTALQEVGLLVSGGAETTRTTIARALVLFCDHPEAWEALAHQPEKIPMAVEELLRIITPLNNMFRIATRDASFQGKTIRSGDRIALLYPSANRDEEYFSAPHQFVPDRDPNPHIAFGFGTHFCLGASLARMTLRVVFEELTQRLTALEVAAPPVYEANIFVKAVTRFDLQFARRKADALHRKTLK